MRLSVRKALQAVFLFSCFIFLNSIYISIVHSSEHSDTRTKSGAAGDPARQDGDKLYGETSDSLEPDQGQQSLFLGWFKRPSGDDRSSGRSKRSLKYKHDDQKLLHVKNETLLKVFHPTPPDPAPQGHRRTELDDVFISVKTSKRFHQERLGIILDTWHWLARDQTYFFTDADDEDLQKRTRNHMINTHCSPDHARASLCCKMSQEYDTFISSEKRWFCHVDDDTYVNVVALVSLLRQYNHTDDWYLGKPSLNHPVEKQDINNKDQKTSFWFATGGAGFCLSRAMALKMMPYTAGGKFMSVCEKIRLPDDCTIGFIVYYYVKKELTVIRTFHSHLEGQWNIQPKNLEKQLTFSYVRSTSNRMNVVNIDVFNKTYDPTRFRSIHCTLYPNFPGCPTR